MIESKWDHTDRADTLHAHTQKMQLQALITAEELPIHLHIRGQSERTALRKLQPCNLQLLSRGGGQSHIHTCALLPELYHLHTYTHWHWLFPCLGL